LVSADEESDAQVVTRIAEAAGLRGLHAGPSANSAAAKALTVVILTINRPFKVPCVGIQLTGLQQQPYPLDSRRL
jgi:predicted dinucleotide-binding enzyme